MLDFSSELVEGGRAGYGREGRGLPGAGDSRRRDPGSEGSGSLRGRWINAGGHSSWNVVRPAIEFIG